MTDTTQTAQQLPVRELRIRFFDYLFGDRQDGYLCIASANKSKANFTQKFFEWPAQRQAVSYYLDELEGKEHNLWFCVNLLKTGERKKEFATNCMFAWADLDEVDPSKVSPAPTAVVESSPGRYHAYWRISGDAVPPDVAEDYSRRIAYSIGADKSGWDLTQLLRVPWTSNFKYDPAPAIKLLAILPSAYDADELDGLIPVLDSSVIASVNGDEPVDLPENLPSLDQILYAYKASGVIDDEFKGLFTTKPDENADWSRIMWRFINKCLDAGMTREEVYVVASHAACNKLIRDGRPVTYLWREVQKAADEHVRYELMIGGKVELLKMPHLADFDQFEEDTFIRDYKQWANQATDAPEQYHELTCFIALSAITCAGLRLDVEWGEIVPNLWGLVLGESTLTRKSTAMRLAVDMLADIDDSLILATDGTAEGLLTGLSHRPSKVSIFWKDEVSGFFDSINRKDYLAGLPETLTLLYDVPKVLTRMLRKEVITISEPYFIFFGGGIRDKVYSLVNEGYILSGFLPRFLVVSGENDLSRLRRTGPPTQISTERKDNVIRSLADLKERYSPTTTMEIAGQKIEMATRIEARLTPKAWELHSTYEELLIRTAHDSEMRDVALPTFQRLGFSLLKMSLLVAASRREPDDAMRLEVTDLDVRQAAFYIEKWGHYSIDLLMSAGRSSQEKVIDRAIGIISRKNGLTKAELMQRMHLSAREAKDLIDTLIQRGLVDAKQAGRGLRLYII